MEQYAYGKRKASDNAPVYKGGDKKKTNNKYVLAARFAKRTLLQKENRVANTATEKKTIDTSETETMTTTNQINTLNLCVTGDDFNNREGRKIVMKSIRVRIFAYGVAATTTPGVVRWSIVYDKQTNGAAPAGADIFASNDALDMNNLNNRDRFVTVATDTFPLGIPSGGYSSYACDRYVKLNLPTVYNATNGGTVADIVTGGLFLTSACIGFSGTLPTFVYKTRVRFEDN